MLSLRFAGWIRCPLVRRTHVIFTFLACSLAVFGALGAPQVASAEGSLRVAEQYGITYLLLDVAHDQHLIEQEGRRQGVNIKVDWLHLSGGAAVNDALLSGSIDVGSVGLGPLLTAWDRTLGKQNVKGIAALGRFPYYLISTSPNVHSIADLSKHDHIAVPAVTVSVQSRLLQMAAAQRWGDHAYNRFDPITQAIPNPDAAAAIISGGTEITGHFAGSPFQEQELAGNPKAHIILKSYDVPGSPGSIDVLYTTQKFRDQNPKTYRAFIAALEDAVKFVNAHPDAAADIYLRVNHSKLSRALLLQIIHNPRTQFSIVPKNTLPMAQFMYRIGAIHHKPASWKDYFFADPATANGS